jgi:restriction system protein
MSVWMVRAGKQGQNERYCLDNNIVGTGWREVPDLTDAHDRDAIRRIVESIYSGAAIPNYTGQLWRLRHGMEIDDLVVLPLKTTSQIAIGRISGGYKYNSSQDPDRSHAIPVEWLQTGIPRTAIRQDLLFSLGSAMTICAVNRNDAEWRIEQIAATGKDPGARISPTPGLTRPGALNVEDDNNNSGPETGNLDLERYAVDQLTTRVGERFAGYDMQTLVAEILRVEGYHAEVPPEGADGGINVVAGSGPLGLDSPRLIVQVKSGSTPVDAPTVQQLQGAITTHGADYGLLVAWGGLTGPAVQAVRAQRFRIRVWNADDLIKALSRTYNRLPDEIQAKIPLKPVLVLVENET